MLLWPEHTPACARTKVAGKEEWVSGGSKQPNGTVEALTHVAKEYICECDGRIA